MFLLGNLAPRRIACVLKGVMHNLKVITGAPVGRVTAFVRIAGGVTEMAVLVRSRWVTAYIPAHLIDFRWPSLMSWSM